MVYYAVAVGKTVGIFTEWNDCKDQITGFPKSKYKKFKTKEEAEKYIVLNSGKYDSKITDFFNIEPLNVIQNNGGFIYTDGGCINNGKSNAKAGIGIYFGDGDPRNVSERIEGKQSNNTAELKAIIKAFKIVENELNKGSVMTIVTDSEYAIKCATSYGEKCAKNGWKADIPNKELVKDVYILNKHPNIGFLHILSHTNKMDIHSIGNREADNLASKAIGIDRSVQEKIYLNVLFSQKDEAKKLGAKWDSKNKKWFTDNNNKNKQLLLNKYN